MTKELKKRIYTSIALITLVVVCLFFSNFSWLLFLTIVSLICWIEFINLSKKIWKRKPIIILPIFCSLLFIFLFSYTAYVIKIQEGIELVLFILFICISSDVGGYVVGKKIGGKKLTKISPKKTVSGSIGSFLFSVFFLVIWGIVMKESITKDLILFSLLISFACQIGDLIISYFKRLAKVKDTGNILPGHGGMLDRIDGIIFALPTILISYPL